MGGVAYGTPSNAKNSLPLRVFFVWPSSIPSGSLTVGGGYATEHSEKKCYSS